MKTPRHTTTFGRHGSNAAPSRRSGSLLPALALLLALVASASPIPLAGNARAAANASLEVKAPGHVEVGESIELQLVLHQSRDVAGYETALLFDTAAADFSVLKQRDNDLKKLGRDVTNLAAVEVPYGASVGLFTCPTQDCLTRKGAKNKHGGNGTVKLGTVVLIPHQAGLLQINLGPTRVVDASGATLPLDLSTPTLTIQVGASGAGPLFLAPASPWSLPAPATNPPAPGNIDLTGDGRVTNADAMEVALVWTWLRNHSQACGALPRGDVDLNHDGCVDVADMQLVAAGYTTDATSTATSSTGADELTALSADMSSASAPNAAPPQAAAALVFTVNSTSDDPDAVGDGICATASGACTLRAAIREANRHAGPDTINFNIPGSGTQTILLTDILPTLSDETGGTTIDGYTQPGATANTDPAVSNAAIRIQLQGAGEEFFGGIAVTSSNNLIRGLALYKFAPPIHLYGAGAASNVIAGDFIGTNAAGSYGASSVAVAQAHGVHLEQGAHLNSIGGTALADRNVISGNGRSGIGFWHGQTANNVVINNLIGLKPNGTNRLSNMLHGVDNNFGANHNRIGGLNPGERNVISGNQYSGVDTSHDSSTAFNEIVGNYIGVNALGKNSTFSYNRNMGLRIKDGAANNSYHDNIIGSNHGPGIDMWDYYTSNNQIYNNRIGIAVDGTAAANPIGVQLAGNTNTLGPNNVIAFNTNQGVRITTTMSDGGTPSPLQVKNNTITRNSIYSNGNLGIDIDPLGVNVNDPGDADTGPNTLLNYPDIAGATPTQVSGTACAGCKVEVFIAEPDANGFGEGKTFLADTVAASNGAFVVAVSGTAVGTPITATATDAAGDTSEFAHNFVTALSNNTAPVGAFTSSCTALACNFDGSASMDPDGSIASYAWAYGDGTTGTGATSSHTYKGTGTYTVILTVIDNAGAINNVSHDVALALPLPGTVQAEAYASGGAGVGYLDTTPGNSGNQYRTEDVDIQATTDTGGGYNVGWTVAGEWLAYNVNVQSAGVYAFTARLATLNAGGAFHLEVDGVNVTGTIAVAATGGNQTWKNVSIAGVSLTAGPHTLKFFIDTGGFNFNYLSAANNNNLPTAAFTFNCVQRDCTFDGSGSVDSDGSIVGYSWTFGDSATGTGATTAHSYATAGSYTVTLTVTDNGGATNSVPQVVVLNQQPPTAAFTSNCSALGCSFDGSGSVDPDGSLVSYAWTFGDGTTGTGATTTHTYSFTGQYSVQLTVTDNNGASGSVSNAVATVEVLPTTLQAENYKVGGAGVGFFDTTAGNSGNVYRADAVDIQATTDTGGGYNVGWTAAGEWLAWDLSVPNTAVYTFTARVAAPNAGSSFHLEVDGTNVTGAVAVPKTNAFQTWKNVTTGNVTLTAGAHTLKFVEDTGGFNFNYLAATTANVVPVASFTSSCNGLSCAFDGSGSIDPDGSIVSYSWAFGDGSSATGATTTHTYATGGSYTVTLTVTDNLGATNSVTHSASGSQLPTAAFTFSCVGGNCSFDGSGSSDPDGSIVSYAWTFGDSGSGSGATTSHTYATSNTFSVTLTVIDDTGGSNSVSHDVSVTQAPPVAAFTFTCDGLSCTFDGSTSSDSDGTIASYDWTFGDGTIATGVSPSQTYATGGVYSVSLTVTDNSGGSNSIAHDVSVTLPPTAAFTFSCVGLGCTFDGSGSSDLDGTIASYAWDFGDSATGSGAGPAYTYAVSGTYTATLTVTDDFGATNSVQQQVVTNQLSPAAAFTFSCAGLNCNFDGSGSNDPDGSIAGYTWDFGDGGSGTGVTTSHTFAFSGQYTVTLTVTDNVGATGGTSQPVAAAVILPTTLQAENYKVGGAGVGFFDTTAGNSGNVYRADAVDIQATTDTGGGYNVGWTVAGEWLAWDVNVPSTAVYTFTARVAAPAAGSRFHLEVDGVNVTGAITVPKTNGYQTWKNVTTGNVTLTAGTHTLTFVEETGGFNLNYIVATAH